MVHVVPPSASLASLSGTIPVPSATNQRPVSYTWLISQYRPLGPIVYNIYPPSLLSTIDTEHALTHVFQLAPRRRGPTAARTSSDTALLPLPEVPGTKRNPLRVLAGTVPFRLYC